MHIPAVFRNKYLLAFAAFCVIILFLDKNDLLTQIERKKELRALENSRDYYSREITRLRKDYQDLTTEPSAIEKLAREAFYMKRDNEELFLIPEKHDSPKN
jgi:cell division protein FtsB